MWRTFCSKDVAEYIVRNSPCNVPGMLERHCLVLGVFFVFVGVCDLDAYFVEI